MDDPDASPILTAQPPRSLRWINGAADGLKRLRLLSFNPTMDSLMKTARSRTGLHDFGADPFEEDLRAFLECFRDDQRLRYTGVSGLKGMVINSLERRLAIQRDVALHPEILEEPIAAPVYVVGFPRSGTTLMQNLLIQHPGCRWLRGWEPMTPYPSREDWGTEKDPRAERYRATAAKVKKQFPLQDQIHSWDNPGECWILLYASFVAPQLLGSVLVDRYRTWWEQLPAEAFERAYRFYKKQLQHLTWCRRGTHWVLKETFHMTRLDCLLGCFPDARIIQTHRDPVECIASACSMIYYQFRCYDSIRDVTPEELGRHLLNAYGAWARNNVALRRRLPETSFYDVSYKELVKDPLHVVGRIYESFGMDFSAAIRKRMETWLTAHHGEHRPKHVYRLEQFGLSADDVNRACREYREFFNV